MSTACASSGSLRPNQPRGRCLAGRPELCGRVLVGSYNELAASLVGGELSTLRAIAHQIKASERWFSRSRRLRSL